MSENPKHYPCGHPLWADEGALRLCPRCLILGALAEEPHSPRQAGERSWVAPSAAELGDEFPGLEFLELLGQGGMGAVYKARQQDLDRLVAVKLLPRDPAQHPALIERFHLEARVLAQLSHPSIVRVYDSDHSPNYYCFVMELVAGPSLRDKLHAGPLEAREALDIALEVCNALDYAHRCGVVHRDIKPENILFEAARGDNGPAEAGATRARVRLADFGLAKLLLPAPYGTTMTEQGQLLGTFHYMAPEQMQAPQHVDRRTDLYALGVVLYEMLTGELPLGRFPSPRERAKTNKQLDGVVLRCLEKDPDRRFQDARELSEALGRCMATPGRSRAEAPSVARGWKVRGLIGAVGLALAVAVALVLTRSGTTRREAHDTAGSGTPSTRARAAQAGQEPGESLARPGERPFPPEFLVPYAHLRQPQYASIRRGREGFLEEMASKYGRSRIAMFWVRGLPGDVATYVHDQLMAIAGTDRCDGIGAFDSLNIVVAPVDDIESLASKVTFGRVTSADRKRRIVSIQAAPSRLPPPLPADVTDPKAPNFYQQSLEDLGCWDRHRRLRVAVRLVDAPPTQLRPEIAAALEALLGDPSAQTRKVAAQALAAWGDAANLPALRRGAESQDARVAEAARQAIHEIERRRP